MTEPRTLLDNAWNRLVGAAAAAPQILDAGDRAHVGPELVEGYDYWCQVLTWGLRRELHYGDTRHPMFHRGGLDTKIGFDNPDNVYEVAKIDPSRTYRVVGARGTAQFLEVSVSVGFPGVVMPVRTVSKLDTTELEIGSDGILDVTVGGPQKDRNWLAVDSEATSVLVRQVFGEWRADDVPGDFRILTDDHWDGEPSPLFDADEFANRLNKAAEFVETQNRYWISYIDDLRSRIEVNTFENPGLQGRELVNLNAARAYFTWGLWDLNEDQALVVEIDAPDPDAYLGFHLCNYWLQSLDYVGRITSLNNRQARIDSDGRIRYVFAHRDPGAPNWLDISGHSWGAMVFRTALTDKVSQPEAKVVPFAEIRAALPDETPFIDEDARRDQIRTRRAHVASRFRW